MRPRPLIGSSDQKGGLLGIFIPVSMDEHQVEDA